jgi:hypothetical protein
MSIGILDEELPPASLLFDWLMRSSICDQHVVFEPDATHARQVNPRLDCDDHAADEHIFGQLPDPGLLVRHQPQTVSQGVIELLSVTGLANDLAGYAIDGGGLDARVHGLDCPVVRLAHDVKDLSQSGGDATEPQHAGQVAPVPVHVRPPVDQQHLVFVQLAAARRGVWQR